MRAQTVLVSVGSTRYDALVHAVLRDEFLRSLRGGDGAGAVRVVVQHGAGAAPRVAGARTRVLHGTECVHGTAGGGVEVYAFAYTAALPAFLAEADIVVAHGGAGTLLDALRTEPAPRVVVVPNAGLMDDHQQELAHALAAQNCVALGRLDTLAADVAAARARTFRALPPPDAGAVRRVVESAWGA
ncbi:hypothetical protein MSPP1_001620 [Malassezia sp. CBS 17886]|nr:hypothetical protein MSPP1_001620 [Malassezia sp. CBS 17886]